MTCLAVTSTCLLPTCKQKHLAPIGHWKLAIGNWKLAWFQLAKKPLATNLEKHLATIGLELSCHSLTLLPGDNMMWEELEAIILRHGRIWKAMVGYGMTWKDMGGCKGIWVQGRILRGVGWYGSWKNGSNGRRAVSCVSHFSAKWDGPLLHC